MSSTEIILVLAAIILPVLTYFAGVRRGELKAKRDEQREDARAQEERIRIVEDNYMENAVAGYALGLHGLILAGVANLENDSEIRAVCRRIEAREEKPPLGRTLNFEGIDLHEFFSVAKERGYDFLRNGNPEELVNELRKRRKEHSD